MISRFLLVILVVPSIWAAAAEAPWEHAKTRDPRPIIMTELDRELARLLGSWIEMSPQERVSYALSFVAQTPGLLQASGISPNALNDLKTGRRPLTDAERTGLQDAVTKHFNSSLESYLGRLKAFKQPKSFGHSLVGLGSQGVIAMATGILTSAALWSGAVPEQSSMAILTKMIMTFSAVYLSYLPIRLIDRLAKEGIAQQEYQSLIANAARTHGIPYDLVKSWYILRYLEGPPKEIVCAGLLE